jgi:hypothetical protein
MPILKAGVLYFGLVFGVGFVLGAIRTLWVVPPVGTRMAEIMETSIMLVVTIVTARVVGSAPRCAVHALRSTGDGLRRASPHGRWEFGFVLWIRGMSIGDYLGTRDPVSGTVYYVMLVVFAAMPLLVARR